MEFLKFIAEFRTPLATAFFQFITYFGQEMIVIALVCWLYWCANKKLAYMLGFSYFTSGLLVQGLKITFRIPRPWILDPNFQAVPSALPDATGYSFPSGHTQSITALMGTLGLSARKRTSKLICYVMIFLVGFSRMYLGCHTPKDVIVSFIVSYLCVQLCHYFIIKHDYIHTNPKGISLAMLAISILLFFYTYILYRMECIPLAYASDCAKACGAGLAFSAGYYIEETRIQFALPGSISQKMIRFFIGLLIALLLLMGLKAILGASLFASCIRYFLTVSWIVYIYPLFFKKTA